MHIQQLLQKKAFYVFLGVVVIFFVVLINLPSPSPDQPVDPSTSSPTPRQRTTGSEIHTEEEPLIPTPNPTYEAKVREEPFWTLLPHWTDRYKIEYRDSADVIMIHLFLPEDASNMEKNNLQLEYRDEALNWLRSNGANIEDLDIQYRIYE